MLEQSDADLDLLPITLSIDICSDTVMTVKH